MIDFEDFSKVELKVGTVLEAEELDKKVPPGTKIR